MISGTVCSERIVSAQLALIFGTCLPWGVTGAEAVRLAGSRPMEGGGLQSRLCARRLESS